MGDRSPSPPSVDSEAVSSRHIDRISPGVMWIFDSLFATRAARSPKASHRAEIDWDAAWILVRELLETGEVRYIFLERSGQQKLRRAARRAGTSATQLDAWIQYHPEGDRRAAIVRHAKGHVGHIHVRFRCARAERRCEER